MLEYFLTNLSEGTRYILTGSQELHVTGGTRLILRVTGVTCKTHLGSLPERKSLPAYWRKKLGDCQGGLMYPSHPSERAQKRV